MSTITVTAEAVRWITGHTRWDRWEDAIRDLLGDDATPAAIEAITDAYRGLLPEPLFLAGEFIYAPQGHGLDLEAVREEVREAAAEVDVWQIAASVNR